MRPNKPINPGAHRSGAADRTSKGRHFVTGLPTPLSQPSEAPPTPPAADDHREGKYAGRASVGQWDHAEAPASIHDEWVDPLDEDDFDLTEVTIDLRPSMVEEPPETYYQRFSSRVPGHQ